MTPEEIELMIRKAVDSAMDRFDKRLAERLETHSLGCPGARRGKVWDLMFVAAIAAGVSLLVKFGAVAAAAIAAAR